MPSACGVTGERHRPRCLTVVVLKNGLAATRALPPGTISLASVLGIRRIMRLRAWELKRFPKGASRPRFSALIVGAIRAEHRRLRSSLS